MKRYLSLVAALILAAPATSQALELGVQDAAAPLEQRNQWAADIGATWERIITNTGNPSTAEKIRESHAAGRKVILTIGGNGTRTRKPSFTLALRYIATLPRAEKYTIGNEPDLDGAKPCTYRKGWMQARRILGSRLLWGDFSPHAPVTYTNRAADCGPLSTNLDVAVHPYQPDDPLARPLLSPQQEGALGNLGVARQAIERHAHVKVTWWLDEFGYGPNLGGWREMTDERVAWMWPRAIKRAAQVDAQVLVIYTAQGPSWDTRPTERAWAAIRGTV